MSDEQDRQRERDEQNWQRKRDDLLDRVKRGEITGEEADAEAEKLGPAPLSKRPARFSTRPADDEFRPESMAEWTLTMALVWILYGDLDEVREWDARYRAECLRWVPLDAGWGLSGPQCPRSCGSKPGWRRATDPRHPCRCARRRNSFGPCCRRAPSKPAGSTTTTGLHVEIPALDWLELEPVLQDVQSYPGKGDEVRRRRLALAKAIGTFEFPPLPSAVTPGGGGEAHPDGDEGGSPDAGSANQGHGRAAGAEGLGPRRWARSFGSSKKTACHHRSSPADRSSCWCDRNVPAGKVPGTRS